MKISQKNIDGLTQMAEALQPYYHKNLIALTAKMSGT
jgi:hypothetical protein